MICLMKGAVTQEHGKRIINFRVIREFAGSFSELRYIERVQEDARLELPDQGVRAIELAEFGPLTVGMSLSGRWSVGRLTWLSDSVIVLATDGGEPVEFALCPSSPDSPSSPFDVTNIAIGYRPTSRPFSAFSAPGLKIGQLMSSVVGGSGASFSDMKELALFGHVREQDEQLADHLLERHPDGKVYIRMTEQCQERCVFCFFFSTPQAERVVVRKDLERVLDTLDPASTSQVILTGGEPTLVPDFVEYVNVLRDRGFHDIVIQTNGILLDRPGMLDKLAPIANEIGFGFSLHAATEATSDLVTSVSRGFFPHKLESIRRASAMGFKIKILMVMVRSNLKEMTEFVELCADLTQGRPTTIQFSLPVTRGLMAENRELYPSLTEIASELPRAVRRGRELGLFVSVCHLCSVPACSLPDDLEYLETTWFKRGPEHWWEAERSYGKVCQSCIMRPWCSGVSREYLDWFGEGELTPFQTSSTVLVGVDD